MLNYIFYIKARHLEKNKKWQAALNIYKKIMQDQKEPSANLAYRYGFVAQKIKDWETAEVWLEKATQKSSKKAQWFYRLALAQEMNKKFALAAETYAKAIELQPKNPEYFYRQGKVLWICGKGGKAEAALYQAMQLDPKNSLYVYELVVAIRKQGRIWQEVEALQTALALEPTNAQWQFELGDAQDKMNHFAEAAEAFAQANALKFGDALWHFREGWAWERAGQDEKAKTAYAAAIAADARLKAKTLGIGVFHQQRGFWFQAVEAYARAAKADPLNAELQYRLGLSYDRCYRWDQAAHCYRCALALEPHKPDWHYRLGFVLERLEQWQDAAKAYEYAATTRTTHTPYWFYRLGYVLHQMGAYEQACAAFLSTRTQVGLDEPSMAHTQTALSLDYQEQLKIAIRAMVAQMQEAALCSADQAAAFYKLGNQAECLQMWQEAAEAYQAAVARANSHNSLWYYRLGYVCLQMGQLEQAAIAFVATRIFKQPHGVDMSRYEKDAGLMQLMEYTEYLETLPVQKKTILYESFLGASLGCNPYAIYQAIVDRQEFRDFIHIWIVADDAKLPFDFIQRPNTLLIKRQSSAYYRYIATAEYLINNVTFPFYFIRREGQRYLNTWHGTPLKGLGKNMPGEFMVHGNVSRNFLQATHLLSPNIHTSNTMMESYDVAGIFNGKLAETGYPRIDSTINSTADEKSKLKKYLGLKEDSPVVLYAPTWRGGQGKIETDIERILQDIQALSGKNYQLVFRGHHFIEKSLESVGMPVVLAGQEIDANRLLAIVDVLITDYSSIFFDFLPTKRPIIYYAYDLEEYSVTRGLYFSLDTMPGSLCQSINEVLEAVQNNIENPDVYEIDKKYEVAQKLYAKFEDGKSTQRAIDFFFNDAKTYLVERYNDSRTAALFYNGQFIPNGITSSFLNLVSNIPKDEILIAIAVEPSTILDDSGRMEKFSDLPANVKILPKVGQILQTPEELWIKNSFMLQRGFVDKNIQELNRKIYQREFFRLYGINNRINRLVNFEGYNEYWMQIFSCTDGSINNVVWLHSNMFEEYKVRMPHFTRNFFSYPFYGKLVSVSSLMNETNKKSLSAAFQINENKFRYCDNTINSDDILKKSEESLDEDLKAWFSGDVFLTIGRLSPEKDQEKLIRAFFQLKKINKDAKLVIIGDGPLRNYLAEIVQELNLQASVFLAGQRRNPFPALKACSCFVLSSNHEGQPIVLIEALVLGKKIIATDIDGNRGILERFVGNLVDNSVSGLLNGMLDYSSSSVLEFNSEDYKKSSIQQFLNVLI